MRKIKKILLWIAVDFLLLFFIGLQLYQAIPKDQGFADNSINPIRLYVNDLYVMQQEHATKQALLEKAKALDVGFSIIDVKGEILITNQSDQVAGSLVDLKEYLYFDTHYDLQKKAYKIALPVINSKVLEAFLVLDLSKALVNQLYPQHNFEVYWLGVFVGLIVLMMLLCLLLYKSIKNRLLIPALELEKALLEVSKGQYKELKVQPTNDLKDHFFAYNRMIEEVSFNIKKQQQAEVEGKKFIATISHELKTPLTSIMAYIEGLKSNIAKDEATQEKYIQIIDEKANKLALQIEELFKLSQQNIDRLKINLEEKYAKEVFNKILEPIGQQLKGEGILYTLSNEAPEKLIYVDAIRIEQVLLNLLNNSKKHLKNNGQIHIKVYQEEKDIVTEVTDNGCGILPKDLPYIFDYFYQGENSRKTDYEGAGLGLAICKHIVEAHKGSIYVKSSLDKGSTFYFSLPIL